MAEIIVCDVPTDSLLAGFGSADNYRDCFARNVPDEVGLSEFIERFYCSMAFRPERLLLSLIRRGANNADARALARGEVDRFAAWNVIERREHEILLQDFTGATASWLSTQAMTDGKSRLLFGSWVKKPERPITRTLMPFHVFYSRVLLGGVF